MFVSITCFTAYYNLWVLQRAYIALESVIKLRAASIAPISLYNPLESQPPRKTKIASTRYNTFFMHVFEKDVKATFLGAEVIFRAFPIVNF